MSRIYSVRVNTNLIRTVDVKAQSVEEAKKKAFQEVSQEIMVRDDNWENECELEIVGVSEDWRELFVALPYDIQLEVIARHYEGSAMSEMFYHLAKTADKSAVEEALKRYHSHFDYPEDEECQKLYECLYEIASNPEEYSILPYDKWEEMSDE